MAVRTDAGRDSELRGCRAIQIPGGGATVGLGLGCSRGLMYFFYFER